MPYDDSRDRGQSGQSGQSDESGQGSATGFMPGGMAESMASGASGSQTPPSSRDAMGGQAEQMQQQQSADAMMQLKEQFEMVIVSVQQMGEQIQQLAAAFPAAQEALQPIIEQIVPGIGQSVMSAMLEVIQQIQAEPMMPPQV